ncbi:kinetochore-associated protein DSN1 homolog isoform X3 [Ornithorhynchus anatinus]|uniref:kinetochore-associated protein DSN1 homolog isoform X3 n=1 Tax=Ornithorhynchus anatinus TaxID=9258 RepID=UPI0010A87FA8|nr:kinetochore-associated protein DSN1 homolog isoform X3 [Ornithorhynchus anatinus]
MEGAEPSRGRGGDAGQEQRQPEAVATAAGGTVEVSGDPLELSRAVGEEMAADERLGRLLLSSFQFSVLQVEPLLKELEGFDPDDFKAKAAWATEEFARHTERLERDGTLRRCCEPRPRSSPNLGMEAAVGEMKEFITRFSSECQAWDRLLLHHEDTAREASRPRGEDQVAAGPVDPASYLETSQSEVLGSKPDYGQIVSGQGRVFDCVELVMDELQASVRQLHAFMDDSTRLLQKMSGQLGAAYRSRYVGGEEPRAVARPAASFRSDAGSRTFRRLDSSPARKLLESQPPKAPR